MAQPTIQTSFASGEWAPKLRSRVDVQKYHAGASLMRNFFVDYSGGGASTRQGTKFIAQCAALGARLIGFQPSTSISYVLEFGANYIRFYINGAQVMSGGIPYQISTPYAVTDLFPNPATNNPGLKFAQSANSMIICHPNYNPYILTINSATNWTLTQINFGPTINPPAGVSATSTLAGGNYTYFYLVTSVDANGQESNIGSPFQFPNVAYLGTGPGTNTLTWTAAPGAVSYNVYRTSPSYNTGIPSGVQYGFVGNVTGTSFIDTSPGIEPDFSQTPPVIQNPFSGASVQSLTLTANANYTNVPTLNIGAAPAGGIGATGYASLAVSVASVAGQCWVDSGGVNPTNTTFTTGNGVVLTITSATFEGGGFWAINTVAIAAGGSVTGGSVPSTVAITSCSNINIPGFVEFFGTGDVDLTWHIGALVLIQGGEGYTTTPAVTLSFGGATATATLGQSSFGNPGIPGFFQERLVLAGQTKDIQGYQMSQPGTFFNFNVSNPAQDDDAISGTIISEELNDIRWLIPVPTGIIAGTGKGAWTINGGGGISTLNPITPTNQTASPQAFNGANDLKPQKINFDVIYGTNKGGYFRDLTYNIYANIFTGSDITTLSNHLFFNHYFLDIAWSEEPFKTMWVVRDDGIMLSLAFVKEQELIGWAHHDTNGQFKSVCSVIETVSPPGVTFGNVVDAVYVIVERTINGSVVQYVERMADRYFTFGAEDSWSVDCALQTAPQSSLTGQLVITGNASAINNAVTLTDTTDAPFTNTMATNNWVVRANGGIYTINGFTSSSVVTAVVVRPPQQINPYTNVAYNVNNGWTIWEPVTSVSGLTQLENMSVVGVADGVAIGPLTVSNTGTVNLGTTASKVTLGLQFIPRLRTLSLDLGEPTVQGRRKKISKIILRVADTLGLQIGTTFSTLVTMKDFQLGAIPSTSTGVSIVTDLVNPSWAPDSPVIDGLQLPDPLWQENGQFCIQQNLPYPATICGVLPEVAIGDTPAR